MDHAGRSTGNNRHITYIAVVFAQQTHTNKLRLYNKGMDTTSVFDQLFEHTLQELMFTSTLPTSPQENRKAAIKNHNLPTLQYIYHGDPDTPLHCLISQEPAFVSVPNWITKEVRIRFRIDFNHIRQRASSQRHSGHSLDKGRYAPSDLFRTQELDQPWNKRELLEFCTMMPVTTEQHSYISQDSSKHDITLDCFPRDTWPWILRSAANWNDFCRKYEIQGIGYEQWIDHMTDITQASIHERLYRNQNTGCFELR